MNLRKLSRLDLNLLVSLQALLEEKSVTRAAARLFISQPAMSRVLQRLRDQLDDPLNQINPFRLSVEFLVENLVQYSQ